MQDDLTPLPFDRATQDLSITQKRAKEDIDLDRHQRRIVFYLVIALLVLATLGSAYVAFVVPATEANHADKEWARSILSAIIAGVVGYAFGKK